MTTGNIDPKSENELKYRRGANALVLEGLNISPSMGKQRNPKLALEIHMINSHSEAGGGGGGTKIPPPGPIMRQRCQCWPQSQTEEARIVSDRAGIVYC